MLTATERRQITESLKFGDGARGFAIWRESVARILEKTDKLGWGYTLNVLAVPKPKQDVERMSERARHAIFNDAEECGQVTSSALKKNRIMKPKHFHEGTRITATRKPHFRYTFTHNHLITIKVATCWMPNTSKGTRSIVLKHNNAPTTMPCSEVHPPSNRYKSGWPRA